MALKAIDTVYKGYRFRSRLEARWAVFFDRLNMTWEYEPEGYELSNGVRYLPDFKLGIPGGNHCWFEVKGRPPTKDEITKAQQLADESNCYVFVASGTMDVPTIRGNMLDGARIVECIPIKSISPGSNLSVEQARALFAGFRHLCGFYEEYDGAIGIDHVYANDLHFVNPSKCRQVLKVCEGFSYETINIGPGRLYRSDRMRAAYHAARSARFEHGQTPQG